MIATLLAVLASQAVPDVAPAVTRLVGRCAYSDAVARFRQEALLAVCDALVIAGTDDVVTFDFGQRDWGSMLRFTGAMSGQRLTINRLQSRAGGWVAATGSCEIFHHGEKISTVSCLAKAGSKTYAANFVPSRL